MGKKSVNGVYYLEANLRNNLKKCKIIQNDKILEEGDCMIIQYKRLRLRLVNGWNQLMDLIVDHKSFIVVIIQMVQKLVDGIFI
ncbi:unnamed protein product [Paramecium sonneborni]|uniref:Uncharacterized protein n=1 Tax=Paramecium sonneborni TaxID=65129 RepID=A0A8S1LP18_9CILI|nr:unnamed protein product [Paramecium sonneborni]